jgi:hypothetical protein
MVGVEDRERFAGNVTHKGMHKPLAVPTVRAEQTKHANGRALQRMLGAKCAAAGQQK